MQDVSAIGVHVLLKASKTYPTGISFQAFPEDSDLGDTGNVDIASTASGVNGDLITWSTANGLTVQLPIIPNTTEEVALDRLYKANRPSKNHLPARDIIQMTITNPISGIVTIYKDGKMTSGQPGYTYGGDGRIRTKNYTFVFEDII